LGGARRNTLPIQNHRGIQRETNSRETMIHGLFLIDFTKNRNATQETKLESLVGGSTKEGVIFGVYSCGETSQGAKRSPGRKTGTQPNL